MARLWDELGPVRVCATQAQAARFSIDERNDKLDLTGPLCCAPEDSGVPVLAAVKQAEKWLWQFQTTKAASFPGGDPAYHAALIRLVLGEDAPLDRLGAASASDRIGAARLALDLLHSTRPDVTLWLPDLGAAHIAPLARAAGVYTRTYRLFAPDRHALVIDKMLADLRHCTPGDLIFVQACCHDPTGLDLPDAIWGALAGNALETGAVPFVEVSGQGLGLGLDKDVDGVQSLCMAVPEAVVTIDCGLGFGLGRDGAGLVVVQAETPDAAHRAGFAMAQLSAERIGTLPDHGPQIVATILHSLGLRQTWESEVRSLRQRLAETRVTLATALRSTTGEDAFAYLATGRGLFAQLPLNDAQIIALREDHAIYARADGRINLSAIAPDAVERLAKAVAAVRNPTEQAEAPIEDPALDAESTADTPTEGPPETQKAPADAEA